jgi:saposin
MFQELEQLLADPKQVCTELGLCSASKEKVMAVLLSKALPIKMKTFAGITMKKHARNLLKAMPVKSSAECILCKFVAAKLDDMLAQNATQQEIQAALDKVCSFLPSTVGAECKQFIDEYAAEILQILSQELNPSMICTALGLCTSKEQLKKLHSNGEACEICTLVATYLKNMLKDDTTDQEIIDALKKGCNYLPSQIASECTAIVSEYGKTVLQLIANSDPKALCTEVGFCTSKAVKLNKAVVKNQCHLGASYWCASRANAVKCNATSFCKKHAW